MFNEQSFKKIIALLLRSGLPADVPIEALRNGHYPDFSHHELDILEGGYLFEESGVLSDCEQIYQKTLLEIRDLLAASPLDTAA